MTNDKINEAVEWAKHIISLANKLKTYPVDRSIIGLSKELDLLTANLPITTDLDILFKERGFEICQALLCLHAQVSMLERENEHQKKIINTNWPADIVAENAFLKSKVKELQKEQAASIKINHFVENEIMDRVRLADKLEKEIEDAPWVYYEGDSIGGVRFGRLILEGGHGPEHNYKARIIRIQPIE